MVALSVMNVVWFLHFQARRSGLRAANMAKDQLYAKAEKFLILVAVGVRLLPPQNASMDSSETWRLC